jgi:hypothetical protein
MSRVVRTSALLAALLSLALLAAGGAAAGSPQAHAAGKCHLSSHEQQPGGGIYLTSLSVKATSCSNGKAVERAFQGCRKGVRGHCHHHVKGFGCKEHRSGIAVQFDSTVNCKRGGKRVHFTYTQNT